jgi:hypothetical protein
LPEIVPIFGRDKIRPELARKTGRTLDVAHDPVIGSFAKRINAGEPFDIYISAPPVLRRVP